MNTRFTNTLLPIVMASVAAVPSFAQNACQAHEEYDALAATVTEQFYDRTFNGLDWNERVAYYKDRVSCTDGEVKVAAIVNELLRELEASHTIVYTREDLDYWGINSVFRRELDAHEFNFAGFWPERIADKWYVRFVFENSPAERAGILPGDELVALNGAPFAPLAFPEGESILTINPNGRAEKNVSIVVPRQSVMRAVVDGALASARILERDARKVGWFRLWAAHGAILEGLNAALGQFEQSNIDALVIDLRGPYGGTGEEYLTKIRESEYMQGIPKFFLIDDSSRSGKEWLSALIRRDGLGTLIGTTTAGAYLAGRRNLLFDDKYFLYVAVQEAPDTGTGPIEGVGVDPHVVVEPCRMYCQGKDPLLEKVFELLVSAERAATRDNAEI